MLNLTNDRPFLPGSRILTTGIAKAQNWFLQVRGSLDPGMDLPRVHTIST